MKVFSSAISTVLARVLSIMLGLAITAVPAPMTYTPDDTDAMTTVNGIVTEQPEEDAQNTIEEDPKDAEYVMDEVVSEQVVFPGDIEIEDIPENDVPLASPDDIGIAQADDEENENDAEAEIPAIEDTDMPAGQPETEPAEEDAAVLPADDTQETDAATGDAPIEEHEEYDNIDGFDKFGDLLENSYASIDYRTKDEGYFTVTLKEDGMNQLPCAVTMECGGNTTCVEINDCNPVTIECVPGAGKHLVTIYKDSTFSPFSAVLIAKFIA